ncbi:hypothetical protein [Marinobacter flavimaris]|uniref:hypothetical protein n=1 Tax=Marinobacter flavimaris TaxID=262076 RepID=UPI00387016D8
MAKNSPPVQVTVYADSNGTHLHQIFTGLDLLERSGEINLKLRPVSRYTQGRPNRQFLALKAQVGPSGRVAIFDMQDAGDIGLPESLDKCDLYYKRSYNENFHENLNDDQRSKIRPFGFNYQVARKNRWLLINRLLMEFVARPFNPFKSKNNFHLHNVKELIDLNFSQRKKIMPDHKELRPEVSDKKYSVLFICRLWDPEGLSEENREDARKVNESRIEIIRDLGARLGDRFLGGIQRTQYAEKQVPDLIIKDKKFTSRDNYLKLVRQSEIVISSSGLLGSTGWKFGEYVALGKAIISEPLQSEVPGGFNVGTHYLEFHTPSQCVKIVDQLLGDGELRQKLEDNVSKYFWEYLEPENLMRDIINELIGPVKVK